MNQNFHIGRGIVIYLTDFNFSFITGTDDGFNQLRGVCSERDFSNGKRFVVNLPYFCTNLDRTTTFAIIIPADIDRTASLEIVLKNKSFTSQMSNAGIQQLVEIMRQDL